MPRKEGWKKTSTATCHNLDRVLAVRCCYMPICMYICIYIAYKLHTSYKQNQPVPQKAIYFAKKVTKKIESNTGLYVMAGHSRWLAAKPTKRKSHKRNICTYTMHVLCTRYKKSKRMLFVRRWSSEVRRSCVAYHIRWFLWLFLAFITTLCCVEWSWAWWSSLMSA